MSDARLAGVVLVAVALLVVVNGVLAARGGYATGSCWRSPLDRKIEHIAFHTREWLWMHMGWVAIMSAVVAGMTALVLLLADAGEPTLAGVGLGLFLVAALCWCIGVLFQGAPAAVAARARREGGETPGWLEPLFAAIGWMEVTYVLGTALAYVVLGAAMVESGFPAAWTGWASVAIATLTIAGVLVARSWVTFPELPLVVPTVVGVALLLT